MISTCLERVRTFMRAQSSVKDGPSATLAITPSKAYIARWLSLRGSIPGWVTRDRQRSNAVGPADLVQGTGFGPAFPSL